MNIPTDLFQPIKIGSLSLSGRMLKAATNEGLCDENGFITDELIHYHETIAAAGTPIQVVGAAYFSASSKQAARFQNACDGDDKIPGMKRLAAAVHKHGGKIIGQPNHPGRQCIAKGAGIPEAVAPSKVFEPTLLTMPRALTITEIKNIISLWADGAERYKKAGFDGVEIHASQGYLVSSFLTPYTNRRTDQYGGSFENRMRFLLELYDEIRKRVGDDFPLLIKINGHDEFGKKGLTTKELSQVLLRLEEKGLNAVEVTTGHYQSGFRGFSGSWRGFFRDNVSKGVGQHLPFLYRAGAWLFAPLVECFFRNVLAKYREGFTLDYAHEFKKVLNIPVIATGGFVHKEAMHAAIAQGRCDMVGVARALVADPKLYEKFQVEESTRQCDFCNRCLAQATMNPVACHNKKVSQQ